MAIKTINPGQFWSEVCFGQAFNQKIAFELQLQRNFSNSSTKDYNILHHTISNTLVGILHYYFNPTIKLSGFLFYTANPEVSDILQPKSNELRPSIQLQHSYLKNRFTLFNKVRYEYRWVNQFNPDKKSETTRFRYAPKIFVNLNGKTIQAKSYYLVVSDDAIKTIGSENLIDLNLFAAGFGYCFTDNISLELTYINKKEFQSTANQITHALSVSFTLNNIFPSISRF